MHVARDLLNRHPISVLASSSIAEAARLLNALDQRFLPVTDAEQRLVGSFTDRELWRAWEGSLPGYASLALEAPVSSVMNRELLTLDPEADLAEIVDMMIDQSITVVPVTDGTRRLLGVIMYTDILRLV